MLKFLCVVLGIVIELSLYAQSLTVDQIELKWRNLYHQGCYAFDAHDYAQAEKNLKESVDLLVSNGATNSNHHIAALIKLGEIYYSKKNAKQQDIVSNQILHIRQSIKPGSKRFIEYLYLLSIYYSNTGNFNEAILYLDEALSHVETINKMNGYESKILHRKSLCFFYLDDISNAIIASLRAVASDDDKTSEYIKALTFYYYKSCKWKELDSIIPRCYNDSREPILRKFNQSKEVDRATLWSRTGLFFTDFLPTYAYEHPSDVLVSYAYNAALFSKGILLAARKKSSELVINCDNNELIKLYSKYLVLKGKKEKSIDEELEMQSISDVILRYQKERKNEYRSDFRIQWNDVQNKLTDEDIAIEFITIPSESGFDDYAALSIKKGMKAPKLTRLANFKQLSSIHPNEIYSSHKLYDLVWKPLETELDGVRNVFFSPAGMFFNTGIEYLPDKDGNVFSKIKNAYRLSSTKEIVISENVIHKKAVLFGGINYNTNIVTMAGQKQYYDLDESFEQNFIIDSLELRDINSTGGVTFLEGTMEEIGEISMILLDSDINTDVYSDDIGSETTFKNLSGTDVNIIHIATHSFYYAKENLGRHTAINKIFKDIYLHFSSEDIQIIDEDKMLGRSGLILAGANNTLKRRPLPTGVEDGLLFAGEIANMDLSNVDLLVLSSCQSGLGDVTDGEGVFGLQRGFKLAGVHSIVMSLWRVNDEATKILMTEMYGNIASGQCKREALFNAQNTLRHIEGGRFDKPEFWAAFVTLDALN